MRCAVYLRISQDRTGEELGVTRQREDAEELVRRRGWEVEGDDYYIDNDKSATKGRRPEWERLMTAIEAGLIQVVVGWTMDRTLRNGRDRLRMLEAGKEHGITIALIRGNDMDLSTPTGRWVADMLGSAAAFEVEMKSDRQRRANQQYVERGGPPRGGRAFGYEPDGMELREPEAALLREAYADVIAGKSIRSIARRWDEKGVPTVRGGKWRHTDIAGMLRNPRYGGIRAVGRHGRTGMAVGKMTDYPVSWPSPVDEDTWRAAYAILSDPERRDNPGFGRKHLLSGLLLCGGCGATIYTIKVLDNLGGRNYWCTEKHDVSRSMQHVDQLVVDAVLTRLSEPDAHELLARDDRGDIGELRDRKQLLKGRLQQLAIEFADDDAATPQQLRVATRRIEERLAEVKQQLADAVRVPALAQLIDASDPAAVWEGLDLAQRRAVIDALMVVTIMPIGKGGRGFNPRYVEIAWKTPDGLVRVEPPPEESPQEKMLGFIAAAGEHGRTRTDLYRLYSYHMRAADLTAALEPLLSDGLIRSQSTSAGPPRGGNATVRYFAA